MGLNLIQSHLKDSKTNNANTNPDFEINFIILSVNQE